VSRRTPMLANAGFRMAYGIGGLLSPAAMGRLRLAADTPERPDARLFVRGFSAHQVGVAALGLASLRWRRLRPAAALAAGAIDLADLLAAAIEAGKRSEPSGDLLGGAVFSTAGVMTAAAALRAPR
jgi:hypothetical protein